MPWHVRALRAAASAVAAAALLALVSRAYQWNTYDRPLRERLGAYPYVLSYQVLRHRQPPVVRVTLRDVPNLREAYLAVEEAIAQSLPGPFRLEVQGRPDPRLVEDYYALHYLAMEAAARGTFTEAARQLSMEAARRGIPRARLLVDERYVYVQLHRGPHYLYAVIPRPHPGPAAEAYP